MSSRKTVIVTGGAGYIGSTICSALSDAGHKPIVWDSLVTGQESFARRFAFFEGDIADNDCLTNIKRAHPEADTLIHCAARIIVPESTTDPALYYRENVSKSLTLFENLRAAQIRKVVFSSSASVYAQTEQFAVQESDRLEPKSPYARTKAMMEEILQDFGRAYGLRSVILRYFNPIGADPHLRTGPFVSSPSHLLGRLVQVATGRLDRFMVTGCNWPTRDGSGIRDYIHVWDLALAHVKAVEKFDSITELPAKPFEVINLGTGSGVTVKEFVKAFESILGRPISKGETGPRPGDNAGCFTVTARAKSLLEWRTERSIEEGISSALAWEENFRKDA